MSKSSYMNPSTIDEAGIEIIDGDRGINYPHENELLNDGFCLFLSAKNVTKKGFKFNETIFISKDKNALLSSGKLNLKDIVLTTRGTVGNIAYYHKNIPFRHIRINSGMVILRIKNDKLNQQFIYQLLKSPYFFKQIERSAFGSAQPQLTVSIIKNLKFNIPLLPYQRKIARILTTVDNIIDKTEASIAKYKAIKQGMMHDFFTRGIDAKTRKLRPAIEDAPKLYKPSELGMIPKEWKIVSIEEFASNTNHAIVDGPFGSNLKSIHYRTKGIPIIQSGFVTNNEFIANAYLYVDKEKFYSEIRSEVIPGDIVMAKIGAQCGTCAILPDNHPIGIIAGNCLKITVGQNNNNKFLESLLHYFYDIGRIDLIISTTAQPAVSMSSLKKMPIQCPMLNEQNSISKILTQIKSNLATEVGYYKKLIKQKQGLMQDLLTGKKEVVPDQGDFKELED